MNMAWKDLTPFSTDPILHSHAELRVNQQDLSIIEVASRTIGGDCARSFDDGSNFNLEELVICLAIIAPFKK